MKNNIERFGFLILLAAVFIVCKSTNSINIDDAKIRQEVKLAFDFNPNAPLYYNQAGRITAPTGSHVAIWDDYITPTAAMGNTIDYSSAHFIAAPVLTLTCEQNTSTVTSIPLVSISTKSATNCTVNILTSNNQTISILGSVVTGLVSATGLSTMKLHIRAKGYTMDQP